MKSQKILGIVNILLLLHGKEHTIYFDNILPCNVNLLENLKSRQINVCGVVKKIRKYLSSFISTRSKIEKNIHHLEYLVFPTK